MARRDFALAVLGSGEPRYERYFSWLQENFRDRVCFYRGYSNKLAHWIEAGSDLFLMPSRYEPCGLNQMYSLRYGTVPIVRETGGLADSVEQINPARKTGTGILFRDYNEDATDLGDQCRPGHVRRPEPDEENRQKRHGKRFFLGNTRAAVCRVIQ